MASTGKYYFYIETNVHILRNMLGNGRQNIIETNKNNMGLTPRTYIPNTFLS
jgi:hypothetical protein